MSKIIDNICKLRDLLAAKDDKRLVYSRDLFRSIYHEMHRHVKRKSENHSYQLDFTSQDLRELAADLRETIKRWDTAMNPEKNIKALKKQIVDGKLDLHQFSEEKTQYCILRADNIPQMIGLLNLCEYYGVFLYFLEIASNDEFALKYTERF